MANERPIIKLTEYIKEQEVLKQWPMSKATLIRERKKGLPFVKLGAYICYKPSDLEAHFLAKAAKGGSDDE